MCMCVKKNKMIEGGDNENKKNMSQKRMKAPMVPVLLRGHVPIVGELRSVDGKDASPVDGHVFPHWATLTSRSWACKSWVECHNSRT